MDYYKKEGEKEGKNVDALYSSLNLILDMVLIIGWEQVRLGLFLITQREQGKELFRFRHQHL